MKSHFPSSFGFVRYLAQGPLSSLILVGAVGCAAPVPEPPAHAGTATAPPVASVAPSATTALGDRESSEPRETEVRTTGGAAGGGASQSKQSVAVGADPAPPPAFFEGRERVTYKEFIDELRTIADELAEDSDVKEAHAVLLSEKGLTEEELPLESFSRARLAFESARDSGLWGIRGTVTDQMPWSDRIWEQWKGRKFSPEEPIAEPNQTAYPTAVAECDELGALFSILARDLGVVGFVGLHWPYWNHVVPVWQVEKLDGSFVRIVVPATQTFLDKRDTIGTTGLKTNRVVFPYVRKDRRDETEMSAELARYLLTQSQKYGGLSTKEFTNKRLWHRWNNRPGAPERKIEKTPPPKTAASDGENTGN